MQTILRSAESNFDSIRPATTVNHKWFSTFIILSFLVIPLFFYAIYLVPGGIMEYKYKWFTISSNGFPDVSLFLWYVGQKLTVILFLCLWFFTSRNWWRYAILSPMVLFSYQLYKGIQPEVKQIEETEYMEALPIILIFVGSLVLLAQVIKYQSKVLDLRENINKEIEHLLVLLEEENGSKKSPNTEYRNLIANLTDKNAQVKLEELLTFRHRLMEQHGLKD